MKKTFHFLSGLPRSGSTVLESLLNQNPEVYVTPTSPLLHLLNKNQEEFHRCPEVIAKNPDGFRDMHKIRPKVEKTAKDPREILGDKLYERFVELEQKYT